MHNIIKILVIISSDKMYLNCVENIKILKKFMNNSNYQVEYAGISSYDDFINYEDTITFKYKMINQKLQYDKICDFITTYYDELSYDWYIKIRPEIKLLDSLDFTTFLNNKINARARFYIGPKKISYGLSIMGKGNLFQKNALGYYYDKDEKCIVLDDQIFIFGDYVIKQGGFDKIPDSIKNHECFNNCFIGEISHTYLWATRNVQFNVVGINVNFTKYGAFSGNIDISNSNLKPLSDKVINSYLYPIIKLTFESPIILFDNQNQNITLTNNNVTDVTNEFNKPIKLNKQIKKNIGLIYKAKSHK